MENELELEKHGAGIWTYFLGTAAGNPKLSAAGIRLMEITSPESGRQFLRCIGTRKRTIELLDVLADEYFAMSRYGRWRSFLEAAALVRIVHPQWAYLIPWALPALEHLQLWPN